MPVISRSCRALLCGVMLSGLATPLSAAPQLRRYSADLMVRSENIGEVVFTPKGDRFLIEHLVPYEEGNNFGIDGANLAGARLMETDPVAGSGLRPVAADANERISFSSYSPSGARAAVRWFDGKAARLGIYDLRTRTLRKLDLPANSWASGVEEIGPNWLSEDEFILFSESPEQQQEMSARRTFRAERRGERSRTSWSGRDPALSVMGSGRYWSREVKPFGTMYRVNANTGAAVALGSGRYLQWTFSPDRRHLAAVREVGELDFSGKTSTGAMWAEKKLELVVYDADGASEFMPCGQCSIVHNSLRWSPGGTKIFFSAHVDQEDRFRQESYIYHFNRSALERFEPAGLDFDVSLHRNFSYVAPFVWLTDEIPAVRIAGDLPETSEQGSGKRYDWYALPPGRPPVALTAGMTPRKDEHPLEDFVTVYKGDLLMMIDGDLWRIGPGGARDNLTQGVVEDLLPWCSLVAYYRGASRPACRGLQVGNGYWPIDPEGLKTGWLALSVLDAGGALTGELLFLNIETGETRRLRPPGPGAKIATVSAAAKAAIYIEQSSDGDNVFLASAGREPRQLLKINQHLAGVAGGQPVPLTRREPGETQDRHDWLLLPPDHEPGQRHPLLVYFYPDRRHGPDMPREVADLRDVSQLNLHVAAAQGYAVLLASAEVSDRGSGGNPMVEMHEQLIRAAENVVQAGYADPERWALMGHSYGGYGVASVITQTNRFKAAIAGAGVYNLTSAYAADLYAEIDLDTKTTGSAQWSEGGQGRMIVPPWQDPQRYIANSPLFHADRIETPLMLVHGTEDTATNVTGADQMFHALLRQGKDALYLRYWGEGHTVASPANLRDFWSRAIAWLDEHLEVRRDGQGLVVRNGGRSAAEPDQGSVGAAGSP